ncbi:toxin-activating lysine-acyltransferase [Pararhizobium sp. LjRoot238]|uniref:toxin-activating lysine-acyltransferase n=1 Tax=Pararhizobium sp. LjRoot238 TaxID=3342293 RepID=UPI003ECCFB98
MAENDRFVDYYEALGIVIELCFHAKKYHGWDMFDIQRNFIPALKLSQFHVFFDQTGAPNGFITWAFFDEELHRKFFIDGEPPAFEKWNSGPHLWLMDTIAPFGDTLYMIRELARNRFREISIAHSVKRAADGSVQRIKVWKNSRPLDD